ncbi:hypothetical protein [Rhizobium sp. TRM95796]|uniref:hypothetical protein n=1 Tax=Rhizobium sp. TRM95796 TaxID=2979862 RepID=UPI0021E927F6|nr:hypothetical protein [Rhizobium sp. TRM95796]MCV3764010.1 hypothetical protein [Rhizobium sp. TRM95796]
MDIFRPRLTLANLLVIDAFTCAVMGVALCLFHAPVGGWTGIPGPLLFWAGAALLPVAAFMTTTALIWPAPSRATTIAIAGNALWIVASLALPMSGAISPNPIGWAFLTTQAVFVAMLTMAEHAATRPAIAAN